MRGGEDGTGAHTMWEGGWTCGGMREEERSVKRGGGGEDGSVNGGFDRRCSVRQKVGRIKV